MSDRHRELQLAAEANRGRHTLQKLGAHLPLEDFNPNQDVLAVLTQYADLLSGLDSFAAEAFRRSLSSWKDLHTSLCTLAESIQDNLFPRANRGGFRQQKTITETEGADGAVKGDGPVARGEKPAVATESRAVLGDGWETVGEKDAKARRVLWYNWFFVACLITFVHSRLPSRSGVQTWRPSRAVPIANAIVNRAFDVYGASAFYVLDCYSATQHLLSGLTLLDAERSRGIAERTAISLSAEYREFFPPGLQLIYCPAFLIADKTGCSLQAVFYAIGLGEVGHRLKHVSLEQSREGVRACMAIRASLMEKFLLNSEPLRLPANGPPSAETIESLPITSFDMLDEARRAQYREFETL